MARKSTNVPVQSSAARACRILKALKGQSFSGLSNKELAESLGELPSAISLSLNTLEAEGLVTRLENGRYAHSVQLLQIAQAHVEHVNQMQARMQEINARILSGAHP